MPAPAITSPMPIPNAMSVPVDGVPASAPRTPAAVVDSLLDVVDDELGRAVGIGNREFVAVVPDCEGVDSLEVLMALLSSLSDVLEVVSALEQVVRSGRFGRLTVVTMTGTVMLPQLSSTGSGRSVWSPASLKCPETVAGPPSVASAINAAPTTMRPIKAT